MINFNVPPFIGSEMAFVREAVENNHKISGDGPFTKRCHAWLEKRFKAQKTLLTTCLLYTSPSPRDRQKSRMPSSA